jgi:serine phosphatase RsbU (regulator of sigma subunit)
MTFVLSKLQAYLAMAVAALLSVALVSTGFLLVKEKLSHATTTSTLEKERAGWQGERAIAAEALAQATAKNRETEQQLTAQAEKAEHEKQTQIAAVSARADDLRRRLRNAEANAATARLMSATGAIARAPEVAGLRDSAVIPERVGDGLVQLAQRADRVRLQLASCEASYERARDALSR